VKLKNTRCYFEIKYTESEFGNTKNDEKHIQKYNKTYKDKLKIFNKVTKPIFFQNYQIFRNLIYNENGYNIFVFLSGRSDLKDEIDNVVKNYCTKKQQERVLILYIEDMVKTILECNNTELRKHYELFKEKYLI
jgi:hypothetical protein